MATFESICADRPVRCVHGHSEWPVAGLSPLAFTREANTSHVKSFNATFYELKKINSSECDIVTSTFPDITRHVISDVDSVGAIGRQSPCNIESCPCVSPSDICCDFLGGHSRSTLTTIRLGRPPNSHVPDFDE